MPVLVILNLMSSNPNTWASTKHTNWMGSHIIGKPLLAIIS
jgi:hypothetical protein